MRRPRYRINPHVLVLYLALAGSANMVLSAVVDWAAVDDTRSTAGTLAFFAVYVPLWAVIWAAGDRWLPREQAKPQSGL